MDVEGLPIRIALTPGRVSEEVVAFPFIKSLNRTRILVAHRGYDAESLIDFTASQSVRAQIPTHQDCRVQRSVDRQTYCRPNRVERLFSKLEQFRRVATRFDKLAGNFLVAVALASVRLWTRACASKT